MDYIEYNVRVYTNGTKGWFLNGEHHREDGPAVEYPDGTKEWFLNGERHREDGPAIEYSGRGFEWYLNGKPHREDGPAVEYPDGTNRWYLNGELLSESEFNERTEAPACDIFNQIIEINGKKYSLTPVG